MWDPTRILCNVKDPTIVCLRKSASASPNSRCKCLTCYDSHVKQFSSHLRKVNTYVLRFAFPGHCLSRFRRIQKIPIFNILVCRFMKHMNQLLTIVVSASLILNNKPFKKQNFLWWLKNWYGTNRRVIIKMCVCKYDAAVQKKLGHPPMFWLTSRTCIVDEHRAKLTPQQSEEGATPLPCPGMSLAAEVMSHAVTARRFLPNSISQRTTDMSRFLLRKDYIQHLIAAW